MVKILFMNEEGLPEIIWVDRIYIDPDAPTDILLSEESSILKVRIRFTDTDEADSFMDVLFECDKINLKEIANDNPELIVTVEEDEQSAQEFWETMDSMLGQYMEDAEYGESTEED